MRKRTHYNRLLLIIDAIGVTKATELTQLYRKAQHDLNIEFSFGVGRIFFRAIANGTRIYVFDEYNLKGLSFYEKYKHHLKCFFSSLAILLGIDTKQVKVTYYA